MQPKVYFVIRSDNGVPYEVFLDKLEAHEYAAGSMEIDPGTEFRVHAGYYTLV